MNVPIPLILVLALGTLVPKAGAIDEAQFKTLHAQLSPPAGEAWRELPWELSVLEARAKAEKEKKPVYMLVRSGHPLGCV